jgi:hypothetical protein
MQTVEWGPGLWTSLHCMSFNYPENPTEDDKKHYLSFFTLLGEMLPCIFCKQSYKIYLKYFPINDFLKNRYGCTYWVYTLHNLVNSKLGKPLMEFQQCVEIYEKKRAKCGKVIENSVEYETCKKNNQIVDKKIINNYLHNIQEFITLTNQYHTNMENQPDNPNKATSLCRTKIHLNNYCL